MYSNKKRFLSLTLIILAVFVFNVSRVLAQTVESFPAEKVEFFPQPQPVSGILGQDHKYTVTFRGNGEAVVSARIAFMNASESTMSALLLRVPKVVPEDVFSYQIIKDRICIRYETYPPKLPTIYPLDQPQAIPGRMPDNNVMYTPATIVNPHCAEYQEPNHFDYWSGSSTYQKATVALQTDTIRIDLSKPIPPNASGSVALYYRARGYAKHNWFGGYKFQFETLKVEDRIRNVQIGVSTDADLFLRGAQSNVNYQVADATSSMMGVKQEAMYAPMRSAELDSFIQQIGYGTIVKSATDLQPLDSYTVEGVYAASRIGLYSKEIAIGLVIAAVLLIVLFIIIRAIVRKMHRNTIEGSLPKVGGSLSLSIVGPVVGLSFLSSLLTAAYTLLIIFLTSAMRVIVTYEFEMVIMLGMAVISCAIYALIMFLPSIYIGVKKGIWSGIITFVLTIGWLIFYFIILIMVLFIFRMQQNYPMPYRMGADTMMQNSFGISPDSAPLK